LRQYEISNFARDGYESSHNLKYWTRQPYLGFGVDAHSMLPLSEKAHSKHIESLRLATTDNYNAFLSSPGTTVSAVTRAQALEESFFLGLRLNRGISLADLRAAFGAEVELYSAAIDEMLAAGLLEEDGNNLQLTPRGRLLSNEVFGKFIKEEEPSRIG